MTDTSNSADTLDIRDLIERLEELRSERDDLQSEVDEADNEDDKAKAEGELSEWAESDEGEELAELEMFVESMQGNGGDHQWEGDWYPVMLVRDDYFQTYAEELADEMAAIPKDAKWPLTCIDWAAAASELQHDYSSAEFDGVTYWYR